MDSYLFDYDDESVDSLVEYSENLLGKKFSEVIDEYEKNPYETYENRSLNIVCEDRISTRINPKSKGQYGNYMERYFYGYEPNNDRGADFPKIGVELKVTPFKVNKNGSLSAKERLVLTIINYMTENLDDFYGTHMWEKCEKILLLFYNGLIKERTVTEYVIEKVFLYEWFEEDMEVILEDYKNITDKIKAGRAHELSESDGNYLSTCTKGAGKGKDLREQPFSDILAKQRAWELKSSYMTYLINNKIFNQEDQESVVKNFRGEKKPFTEILTERIMQYKGMSLNALCDKFDIKLKTKNAGNLLVKKIMGLSKNVDETKEFQKANMILKVIRVNKNGLPKEDMSFKNYQFKELAENDDWEQSQPYLEIYSRKFLFVIFKENDSGDYILDKVKFWGFPERQLDEVKRVWEETRSIINEGVKLTQNKNIVATNFPQSRKNKVMFTKIHAQNSYYEITPGNFVGKGKLSDTYELPDGRRITKHSFWLSKKYLKQVFDGEWD
ncbi:Sau3AI family type II restriction endonuclease [Streptococcaceae bacterium ESL0687]|nr:Sau3AI family type II restriction endonuclease [Streptococcaceae bacterium ESL0687]